MSAQAVTYAQQPVTYAAPQATYAAAAPAYSYAQQPTTYAAPASVSYAAQPQYAAQTYAAPAFEHQYAAAPAVTYAAPAYEHQQVTDAAMMGRPLPNADEGCTANAEAATTILMGAHIANVMWNL